MVAQETAMTQTAEQLIGQGKRDLLCKEYEKAVENFQTACELLAKEFGDMAEQLAEPNLLYGTALLELAKLESNVVGRQDKTKVDDNDDEAEESDAGSTQEQAEDNEEQGEKGDEDEEGEGDANGSAEEQMETAEEEGSESNAKEKITDAAEDGDKPKETGSETEVNEKTTPDAGEASDQVKEVATSESVPAAGESEEVKTDAGAGPSEENDKQEDEVSTLQLAWEVIEVAKSLFLRRCSQLCAADGGSEAAEEKEAQLKVSDCLAKLAEVSMEEERMEQALEDLQECLRIRTQYLGDSAREVAEIHYEIAMIHSVMFQSKAACSEFTACRDVLRRHLDSLQSRLTSMTDSDADDRASLQSDITLITDLMTEVSDRCRDEQEAPPYMPDLTAILGAVSSSSTNGAASTSSGACSTTSTAGPVDDISHLIRRKRKLDTISPQNGEQGVVVTVSADSAAVPAEVAVKRAKLMSVDMTTATEAVLRTNGGKEEAQVAESTNGDNGVPEESVPVKMI